MFKGIIKPRSSILATGFSSLLVFYAASLQAASLSDSILNIPEGTVFELQHELEVPANQNFITLGQQLLSESFNDLNQSFNQQNSRHDVFGNRLDSSRRARRSNYYSHNDFVNQWRETAEQSYNSCLESYRTYYRNNTYASSNNNTIISRGHGNTNVIINNQSYAAPRWGSYIEDNNCIQPEHTMAFLMLDSDAAGSGGIFRYGYEFEVSSVRTSFSDGFHVVTINFDHDVATGIRIITTQAPQKIRIKQLAASTGDGFWAGLNSALTDIGGNHFAVSFQPTRYFE